MISVIIPVYNAEKYLRRTVASVQAQTFTEWEIVLMDDGSKDSSLEIAAALCREDRRISSYCQANAGGSAARSHGIEKSNPAFPYVLCLDNDDLLLPEALQRLLALLELNPHTPAACGSLLDIDDDDAVIVGYDRLEPLTARRGVNGLRLVRRRPNAPLLFGDLCFRNHLVTPGQVLIRKTALRTAGAFDTSLIYIDDYDLWWRLTMQVGPIPVTPEPVLLYRHHASNLSGNKTAGRTGAAAFRWRLLTHPAMTPAQRRTAGIGYFYDCIAQFGFGLHYLRKGETQHGLKRLALGVRDTLRYFRDRVRAQRYLAAQTKASSR